MYGLNHQMNRSLDDNDETQTLEEEVMDDYSPTKQEIREYAIHLGMNLPEDNQYLDIAKAGLKAKLPDEWKICSKRINGNEQVFYKNRETQEIVYEHPCDLIYQRKYEEAKQIDFQNQKKKKSTGINKFKKDIEKYREPNYLDGNEEAESFMVDSNVYYENRQNQGYVVQNPIQVSATQNLLSQVDQEFAKQAIEYEDEKKKDVIKLKEENKQKLNKMELILMNEADPELFEFKEEYERQKENLSKSEEEKKRKIKRKVEEEMEQNIINQKNVLQKQLERNLENYEYEQEKTIKNKLRILEQELQGQQKDIIKRINQRQKELSDSDSKWMKQIQEKKKNVENQLNKYKKELTQEIYQKIQLIDQENIKRLRTEQEVIKRKLINEFDKVRREYKFEIVDLQEENQRMMRSIKEEMKSQYDPKFSQIQQIFSDQLQNIELSESQMLQSQIYDYKNLDIESRKQENIKKITQQKEKLIQQLQNQVINLERQTNEKYQEMKRKLEETQRLKLEKIQKDFEKKTGKILGNGKEIDLCMEINQTRSLLHELKEEIKQFKRKKIEAEEKLSSMNIVVSKYDLQNELKQKDVIKFDLDRLQYLVNQYKQDDKIADKELELLEQQYQQMIRKHQEFQQKQQTMQNMIQSVNELREQLAFNQSSDNSKFQSNLFRPNKNYGTEINIQNNLSMNQSVVIEENAVQMRKWKLILLDERVTLNREQQLYKTDKEKIKQMRRKLLIDSEQLKSQIEMAQSFDQNNMKKDLIKKLKQEIKEQQIKITDDTEKSNSWRQILKQKSKTLDQMEKNINDTNPQPELLHSLEQLYLLYSKIGELELNDDMIEQQISNNNESYFNQIKIISEEPSMQQEIQQQNYDIAIPFEPPKVLHFEQPENLQKYRMQLIQQKEWFQNYKYRVLATNPYSIDSRERFQRYQQFLHCKCKSQMSNSEELSLEPAYYKPMKKQQEMIKQQVQNTKYYESKDGEPSQSFEMEDKLLEASDEYGYGYWVRFSENENQDTLKYYFLSRLTTNKEHGDLTYYGDRTLSVFLYKNVFVFATYDLDENLKSKERPVKLQENINGNWYFVCYSKQKSEIVGFLVKFGGNYILRFEQYGRHKPSRYYKVIFGGSEFEYLSMPGQFANIYFDFDEPAFINTNEDVIKLIQKYCNMPQELLKKTTIRLIEETKDFSANNKEDTIQMEPFDNEYIITQYSVKGWFRWVDNILVEELNQFQIFNLRSNKDKSDKTGDRALEIHQIIGGGSESQIYFSTYSIIEEQKRITKQLKSNQFVWTYAQFSYDIGSLRAFGYLIYPGYAQSLEFNEVQHKQVTKLFLTIGADNEISSFNGKIAYIQLNVGPKSFNDKMLMDDEGALNLYLRSKLVSQEEDIRPSRYNQIQPVFSQMYDDEKVNGQSEYSFGMWSRWIRTYPIYLQKRAEIHSIAHLKRQYKQVILEIQITKQSYLFQSLDEMKNIEYQELEGFWVYLYFGYNRLENRSLGVVNKLGKDFQSIEFHDQHELILDSIEFYVGKHHTPLFNGEFARIQFQFGPHSFRQESELTELDTQGLPYIIPLNQQTIQLIGAVQQSPIDEKYEFEQFQGITEYSVSGWVKFNGKEKSGEQYHIITLTQRTLEESDEQATLQILKNDVNYVFVTYTCEIECDKYLKQESGFGEYWDQWTYIYFGYKNYQTYTYIEYKFTQNSFIIKDVNHYYMSIFSVLLGQQRKEYLQYTGSLKQWVLNVGNGAYREGSYESEQLSIKVHFGYLAGTDHLTQAQQMKEHPEVLDCQTQQIKLQQSEELQLDGLYEYGYGLWIQFKHYASTINLIKPKLMGIARLSLQHIDHLLSVVMNVGNYQFISLEISEQIKYTAYHESEWIFVYYAYQRLQQDVGETIGFIVDNNGIRQIKQSVLHPLIRDHLNFQVGRASKNYIQFNGLITGIRLYLGNGALINEEQLKQMILKLNRKPTQIYIDNVITIVEDRTDNYNGDNPIHIEGSANQYSMQMWFKMSLNQFLYRVTQNEHLSDKKYIGDRVFHLQTQIDNVEYSTYNLLNMDEVDTQVTQQCKIELYHLNMWTFSYQSYSKQEQKMITYLKIDDYICQQHKDNIIHAISDQIWLYLMKDFNDQHSNTMISHIKLTLGQGSFTDDNFIKLSSFIAGNRQMPKIIKELENVKDSETFIFNEVDSMSEYAVSFWCKFSSTYSERRYRKPEQFQIFRMTTNEQLIEGKIELKDRLLSAYGLKDSFSFNTYDINDNAPNEYSIIQIDRQENRWYFLYAGYKRKLQIAKFYVFDGKDEKQNQNQNLLQDPLIDYIKVIFGSEDHVIGFNGQLLQIAIMIGSGSFGQSGSFLESSLLDYIIQYQIPEEQTLEYLYKQKHGIIELDQEFNQHDFHNVGSYSICGWFKLNYSPLSKYEQETSCQTLIRLYENEKLNDKLIQGDRTMLIQVCDQQFIKFQTYTLNQIQSINEHRLIDNIIDMDSPVIWHYVYMSYDDLEQNVQILLKQFQSDEIRILNNIWHMETNYLGILFGKDIDNINFDGVQQQWQFLYGYNSIFDLNKPFYQDKLPNYYNIKNNQRELWFQSDDITTVEFHNAVNQYAIGVWTRWEAEFYDCKQIQFHNIFRFTSRKQYEDKGQLGDRVLFSYITNKNYEFSSYNKKQKLTAINTQIPYDFIEGEWNYIYFAYNDGSLYAAVIHKQSQKAEHTILRDIEHDILGYAQLIINKPEFGFQSFKGQIYDLRLFLGEGAYLDDTQKVATMINKLHMHLPDVQLKVEEFKWEGCDTQIDEDASLIQEFPYSEQTVYSISGWIWLYSKSEGVLDSLQGVMRLSTDLNFNTLLVLAKSNQVTFGSYSFGKKALPIWQSCDIDMEQWLFVYLSHQDDITRFYVKSEKGVQEFSNVSRHVVPKNFKLSFVKFDSFEKFDGKLKGVQVKWHKPLDEPEDESIAPVLSHQ
ncbi:unnamed protein product [Paramecium pentaurelia]|uniref:WW domain-containing protein n=1 Tax=Paramecium pentaurelia TaxID=43138 RepID=A0A8S1W471_9CILI|nr:unnamed protein product [Paramecium pentaurelia]